MRKIILLVITILTSQPTLSWVSVGFSPGFGDCDYFNISDALLSSEQEIRIVNNREYNENITINKSKNLRGGFGSCLSAQANLPGDNNTVIKGIQVVGESVITINPSFQINPVVEIHNITLSSASNGGSGINIGDTKVSLKMYNSLIIGNSAVDGGGIYIGNPTEVDVYIKDSSVFGNAASNRGGGIFCANANTSVRVVGESLIGENFALNGGGIFATNGCMVIVDSGVDINNSSDLRGIMGNGASNNGGGIYADLGANVRLYGNTYNGNPNVFPFFEAGNSTQPVTLANNSAQNNGGGVFSDRNATVLIIDGLINNNIASSLGGGFYTKDGAELSIKNSSNNECWNSENKCSVVSNNKAGIQGGGLYLIDDSQALVQKSHIFGNRANFGTFVYARDSSTVGTFLNNVIYRNGDDGGSNFDDAYVFRAFSEARFEVHHNSIVNNNITNAIFGISGNNSRLNITNSIVNNNETVLSSVSGASYTASCVLVDETSSMAGLGVANLDPNFVDPNTDDYHLGETSDAIDYCEENIAYTELETDSDNGMRPIDHPITPNNAFGLADAGADEFNSTNFDVLFKNGFE